MNTPNKSWLGNQDTCPDCLGAYGVEGEKGCVCPAPEELITYEIYELITLECPRGGTRQGKRAMEWGRCTAEKLETIRDERVTPYPERRLTASFPNSGAKPRWEGTLEEWIGGRR